MTFEIDKKHVFPRLVFDRPRFDLGQIDVRPGKGLQHTV
jgi:hypothetical protein